MALSLTIIETKIDNHLKILGSFASAVKRDIVRDAVMRYCRKVDTPVISATLAVTASTGPYSIPSTIEKMVNLYDDATIPLVVAYGTDLTKREITLVEEPDDAGDYTAYGTPRNIRTNISTVIAAIDENHEDVLWGYVRAFAMQQKNAASANDELLKADKAARELRQNINMHLDSTGNAIKMKDTTGQVIADSANSEGYDVNVDDLYESDT